MGMFDTLHIELDGRDLKIQTKRFECSLGDYRLGDWIFGSLPGVRVYFDQIQLDAAGQRVYGADAECARQMTVFIVLTQGVFVDYLVKEGELAAEAIETVLRELRERWSDSARLQAFLVETLRTQQQRMAVLERRLGRVQSIIATARRLKAGEALDGRFGLIHEEDRKLAAGDDPLEVIAWVLSDAAPGAPFYGEGTTPDPLEEYRL